MTPLSSRWATFGQLSVQESAPESILFSSPHTTSKVNFREKINTIDLKFQDFWNFSLLF